MSTSRLSSVQLARLTNLLKKFSISETEIKKITGVVIKKAKLNGDMEAILSLARQRKSGTPQKLAKKIKVSERTLYRMVNTLREMGHDLQFSDKDKTYYLPVKPKKK